MKLRLPKGLYVALLAALFALPGKAVTVSVGDYTETFDSVTTGNSLPSSTTPALWVTGGRLQVGADYGTLNTNAATVILGSGTMDGADMTATQLFLQGWDTGVAIDVKSKLIIGKNSGDGAASIRFGADGNNKVEVSGDIIVADNANIIAGGSRAVISGNITGATKTLTLDNFSNAAATYAISGSKGKSITLGGLTIKSASVTVAITQYDSVSIGRLENRGTLTLGAAINIGGSIINSGTINAAEGGTLISFDDVSDFSKTLLNDTPDNGYARYTVDVLGETGTYTGDFTASYRGESARTLTDGKLDVTSTLYLIYTGAIKTTENADAGKAIGFALLGEETSLTIDSVRSESWGDIEMAAASCSLVFESNAIVGTISMTTNAGTERGITIKDEVSVTAEKIQNSWGIKNLTVNGDLKVNGEMALVSGELETAITGTGRLEAGTLRFGNVGTYNVGVAAVNVDKIYHNYYASTLNITGGVVTAGSIELGDFAYGYTCHLNLSEGACLKVTGEDTSSYKTTGILLSEWVAGSEVNINGTMIAEKASVQSGDSGFSLTVGSTGTLLTKGIGAFTTGTGKSTTSSLTLEDGGRLILGTNGLNSTSTTAMLNVTLKGGTIASYADSTTVSRDLSIADGQTVTLDAALYVVNGNAVERGTTNGSTISITGDISLGGTLHIAGISTDGNPIGGVSLKNITKSASGTAGKLSILEGGNLTVSGKVTLGASIENAGTFTLAEGGSLSFTSKDDLTEKKTSYADLENAGSGNGYLQGSFSIVDGALNSKASGISSVTVGGVEFGFKPDADDKKDSFLATDGSNVNIVGQAAQKGLFYIRKNEVGIDGDFAKGYTVYTTAADADNSAGYDATTGLVLDKANTGDTLKLLMKTGLNSKAEKGIIMRSDATIQLETGVSLNKVTIETDGTADIPRLTLTGTGTYVMDKATKLDVDQTTFDAWNGSVAVADTELGGKGDGRISITDLNSLAKHSADPLVISGLSGYACDVTVSTDATSGKEITTVSKNPEVTYNLNLTDIAADENTPAVAALTLTDAPAENLRGGTLTLSGNLSGEGSIVNNSTGDVSLGGDISGWTGSYTASEASSVLTLAAVAELNASVTGGSVTLKGELTLGKTMSLSGNLNLTEVEVVDADSGKNYSTINLCERALTDEAGDPTGVYEMSSISVDGKAVGNASDGILNFTMGSTNFLKSLSDEGEFVLLRAKGGITGYSSATLNKKDFFTDGDVRYYVELGATSVTLSKVTLGLQWKGDVWTKTTGFDQSSALDGDSVVSFTGVTPSKVEVDGAQVVKSINVDAYGSVAVTEYTFTGDSITTETLGIVHGGLVVQNELKVNDLTSIHTGTTLTVNEGGSLTGGGMSNNGTLSIGKGSTVTVGTLTGDGAVSGDGKLVVENGSVSASTLGSNTGTIEMNSLNDSDATTVGGTLLVRQSGSYRGAYNEKTSIGTTDASATQILRADAKLTVIGKAGTVSLTGLNNTHADAYKLGGIDTTGETVLLNNVRDDVSADGTTTKVPTKVTLGSASSMVDGVLDFTVSAEKVNESLNSAVKPVVTTGAALSLKDVTLKVHEVQNEGLNLTTGGQEKDIVLFVVNDTPNDCKVDNVTVNMDDCPWMTKYFTNFRVVQGSVNVIGDANTGRYAAHGQTPNGTAGLALAGKAMFRLDPQVKAPTGELAQVLDMLDAHLEAGNKGAMDKLGAALAGSSLSAVGMAVSDDVQRQLRSIRNRTTTMGVNECVVNEDMPYVNGWISGDGNYRQLSESGTDAGYQVSSWGGTVGVDVDVNPNLTLGVAVSALFGDYTGKAADTLTGDLDTQYVSLFARVSTGSWVNTFVGTLGRADVDLERTLPGIAGKTTYKTNGMMFGFLYEIARTFALNEDASTCVQPLFNMSFTHTSLDSATEGGTADTRLTTDSASLTQFSLGLGGRLQSIVGENEYNRASIFEARALLKLDFGDRYNKLNTALAALPNATVSTRSNESGVIGAEVGATLTIPISQDAGSVFFDVNADFRADQTGVNGSVGYRINF